MRIAQVSPLYESCPPQLYGGTERVVSYLTEELVRQGHEVTLFASGDSQTEATLRAAVRSRRCVSIPNARIRFRYHLVHAEPRRAQRRCVRHHPFSCGFPAFSAVCAALGQDPDDRPWPPRSAGPAAAVSRISDDAAGVDLERSARARALGELARHRLSRPARQIFIAPGRGDGGYLAFIGRISPEKGVERAIEIARRAGMPLKIAAKVDKADLRLLQDQDQATAQGSGGRVHR